MSLQVMEKSTYGGKPTIMDAAEDALMRNKTNYNEGGY